MSIRGTPAMQERQSWPLQNQLLPNPSRKQNIIASGEAFLSAASARQRYSCQTTVECMSTLLEPEATGSLAVHDSHSAG
jgi:hypothetical protein